MNLDTLEVGSGQHAHERVRAPGLMTAPCANFFRAHYEFWNFFYLIINVFTHTDEVARKAARLLYQWYRDDEHERVKYEESSKRGIGLATELRVHREILLQMAFTRGVDNYLTYVAELLALISISRPDTLKSGESVRLDFVLRHSTLEELIGALAERRVERLSYQSMRDLASDLSEKLAFNLVNSDEELDKIVRIVETRNLIVHNRAVVNRRYLRKVPSANAALGSVLDVGFDELHEDMEFLARVVCATDNRARAKFGLDCSVTSGTLEKEIREKLERRRRLGQQESEGPREESG